MKIDTTVRPIQPDEDMKGKIVMLKSWMHPTNAKWKDLIRVVHRLSESNFLVLLVPYSSKSPDPICESKTITMIEGTISEDYAIQLLAWEMLNDRQV